ncbi:MAG: PQQ-binding-like beta-propeller repeat protein [Spirochaetales bacterium]|nr:PQQ-binding-like beta-propeller repeat protein [Spirochaetales bacterium]
MNQKKSIQFIIIICIMTFVLIFSAGADEWHQWRGTNRNSISTEKNWNPYSLQSAAKVLWQINIDKGYSGLAITGDRIYTMGNNGSKDTVYCLDKNTGRILWQYSYTCSGGQYPGPRATPTVDNDRVYTLSGKGNLYCFNALNGSVKWSKNLQSAFGVSLPTWYLAGSPLVVDNMLILNANVSGLAFNKFSGATIWASRPGTGGYASPVYFKSGGTRGVAIFGQKALYGVELATGNVLWSYPWITSNDVNAADPLVFGNKIFISSGYGKGCALLEYTSSSVRRMWQNTALASHFTSPVYFNGFIYGVHGNAGNGRLRALDPVTGQIKLEKTLGFGSFIIVDNKLIYVRENGTITIAAASPYQYSEIASTKILSSTHWTPPSFSNGRLYIRNALGQIVCVDLSS